MGEYWKPVNLTKQEFVHPHKLNCGLKLAEWNHPDSEVWKRINTLVATDKWNHSDLAVIASDHGRVIALNEREGNRAMTEMVFCGHCMKVQPCTVEIHWDSTIWRCTECDSIAEEDFDYEDED